MPRACLLNLGSGDASGEDDGGAVCEGELYIAGGHSSPLLRQCEGALGDLAALVSDSIEPERSATTGALALAVCDLSTIAPSLRYLPATTTANGLPFPSTKRMRCV